MERLTRTIGRRWDTAWRSAGSAGVAVVKISPSAAPPWIACTATVELAGSSDVHREILARRPEARLVVIDKQTAVAQHQTGHNSGVIHSGIYYTPGSLKARLCVEGAAALYDYCADKGIAAERCGKIVVAVDEQELERLDELERRAQANGVQDLARLGPGEIAA